MIKIYTDGSSLGNPGAGGYGTILQYGNKEKEISDGFRMTTNNRMELLAVIAGLEAIKTPGWEILVVSDSKYVVDAVEKGWLKNWVLKKFKNKKNSDLWGRFLNVSKIHKVNFQWVKGHAGHPENERCDQLAVRAAKKKNLKADIFFEKNRT